MSIADLSGLTLDGKYRLVRLLGRGGMGVVYLGQHAMIGRQVAVKILHTEYTGSEEMVIRFYREAQAAAAIGHRNIIDVFDVGVTPDGEPFLVMEFLEGESLAALLERAAPLDVALCCAILEPALQALDAAHLKEIVHRDLKPDNVFLVYARGEEPTVKLIDFGVSKITRRDTEHEKLTQTGAMLGTPAYMAPEQAIGDADVDHRADIYSMGAILYEMLTGKLPFVGKNYNALLLAMLNDDPERPSEINPDCPAEAEAIALKAISRKPEERYQSAREMLDDLKELEAFAEREDRISSLSIVEAHTTFAAGDLGAETSAISQDVAAEMLKKMSSETTPGGWSEGPTELAERRRAPAWLVGVAALAVIAILVAFWLRGSDPREPAPQPAAAPPTPEVEVPRTDAGGSAEKPAIAAGVEITIEGAPAGAKVFYDGSLVPLNPFRVDRRETIVPLRVEADGFEPFSVSVMPSADRKIQVALEPVAPADGPRRGGGQRGTRPAAERVQSPTLKQGGRGAEFTEDFQ